MESPESSLSFQQYWLILKRYWLFSTSVFVAVLMLVIVAMLVQKPTYKAEAKLLLKKSTSSSSITGLGKEIAQLEPLSQEGSPLDTETEIIRSVPIVTQTIETLNLTNQEGQLLTYNQFLEQLGVSQVAGSDILEVSYQAQDAKTAAQIVNTLIEIYLESNKIVNRAEAKAAREFIAKQLPKAQAKVIQNELQQRQFKEDNQVFALDAQANSAIEMLAELETQIAQAESELEDTNAQLKALQKELGVNLPQAIALTSLSQSSGVQEALKELQHLESQLALERSRFSGINPKITNLESQVAALQNVLNQRLSQVLTEQQYALTNKLESGELQQQATNELLQLKGKSLGLAGRIKILSNIKATYQERLDTMPRLEYEQRQLERHIEASQVTYSELLKKFQEIQIAENQNLGNARVISPALAPEKPVAPRKSLYLVTGVLLGGLGGIATALILAANDQSIQTVEDAKQQLGLTLLGLIPYSGKSGNKLRKNGNSNASIPEVIVRDFPSSPISESYRMLQSNLKFVSSDRQVKVMVVTSINPQEGKSTVAANLATAMAQLGCKTLLVDGNLRSPIQQKIWSVHHNIGLNNVIVEHIEPSLAIKPVMKNLDVLTSGVFNPNPSLLLDSQRMTFLIDYVSTMYDFVLIDTPALHVAADALTLGRLTDGMLLVVRPGVLDTNGAAFAQELGEQSDQNIIGMVVNGVIPEHEPHSYYYFGFRAKKGKSDNNALKKK